MVLPDIRVKHFLRTEAVDWFLLSGNKIALFKNAIDVVTVREFGYFSYAVAWL
jgi:hypothetical protein